MGYNPYSLLAAATINVLCIPAHNIAPERYQAAIDRLNQACRVITQPHTDQDVDSNEVANALFFNFGSGKCPPISQQQHLYEPNRQPQLVLGLVDGQTLLRPEDDEHDCVKLLDQVRDRMKDVIAHDYETYVLSEVLVFDVTDVIKEADALFINLGSPDKEIQGAFDRFRKSFQAQVPQIYAALVGKSTLGYSGQPVSATKFLEDTRATSTEPAGQTTSPSHSEVQNNQNIESHSAKENVLNAQLHPSNKISLSLLHLQSGNWDQSFEHAVEAARIARNQNLRKWHARALEVLVCCLIFNSWINKPCSIPPGLYPTSRPGINSGTISQIADANRFGQETLNNKRDATSTDSLATLLPGLVATVFDLYCRSPVESDDTRSELDKLEGQIRLLGLLVLVKINGCSVSSSALDNIVRGQQNAQLETPSGPTLVLPSSIMADVLVEIAEDAQIKLPAHAAVPVYLAVSQNLSKLSLRRKYVFQLKDMLQKLIPALLEARRVGAAEAGMHPSASMLQSTNSLREEMAMAGSIQTMLYTICSTYGIHCNTYEVSSNCIDRAEKSLYQWFSNTLTGDMTLKLEIIRLCIRVSDALPDAISSLSFMSIMLWMARQAVTVSTLHPNPTPLISIEEQGRIRSGIKRISEASGSISKSTLRAHYWDDFLLRDVQIAPQPHAGRLVPHLPQDLSVTSSLGSEIKKDPFIFNPFSQTKAADGIAILVKGEFASFDVLLQNPLEVEVEIESIQLMTEGLDFQSNNHSVVLGPLCAQIFTLSGRPTSTGMLKVIGCNALIRYCHGRQFGIFRTSWRSQKPTKQKQVRARTSQSNKNSAEKNDLHLNCPQAEQLNITVVEPLPVLSVVSCSLIENSIMLLEGETKPFTVTVANSSDLDADFIHFTYEDSVAEQLREAMMNKNLSPADLFEVQNELAGTPTIRRRLVHRQLQDAKFKKMISARSIETFEFDLLGKAGLNSATILIDYGYLGRPRGEIDATFYTRQIRLKINITVNGSINMPRCNVIPLHNELSISLDHNNKYEKVNIDGLVSAPPPPVTGNDVAALQLDLRNIWPHPLVIDIEGNFNVSLGSDRSKGWNNLYSQTLQPGQLERAVFLVPRLFVKDPLAPIPSLDQQRQFVVSTSKISLESEAASRESFWYREELLKSLRMRWREKTGDRKGIIDIRKGIRLSTRMIDYMRIDHVEINFDLKVVQETDEASVEKVGRNHFRIKKDVFVTLIVKIRNRTGQGLRLFLRLQPCLREQSHTTALDLSRRFAWSGVLQRALPGVVASDQSYASEIGIVALAVGEYEVYATVEELRGPNFSGAGSIADIVSSPERKIWHARKPCMIDAVDKSHNQTLE